MLGSLALAPAAWAKVRTENGMYVVDDAEGYAPVKNGKKAAAREEARRMAYRDALEKALGACVTGITEMQNYAVTRDKVFSKASGLVKDFKVVSERVDEDGVLRLTGICKIAEKALDGALGPDVIAMLGNPRIMILVDELVGDKPPFVSATESEALRVFEKAGYLIVDPDQARTLLRMNPAAAFDDPVKLAEAAQTLRADIIIVGRAHAGAFAKQKVHGITLYGVSGTVQLKAVLTQTAYQVSSKTVSQSTGKKPAQTVGGGAERCFRQAAAQAAQEIVYKIAYSMASAGSGIGGITVNIKIANATFQDVETIEEHLRELAGKGGEVFERSYRDSLLELDVVSGKTAREVASFLSGQGVAVEGLTAQTISARVPNNAPGPAAPSSRGRVIALRITEIASFEEAGKIEDSIREWLGASGEVIGQYREGALELAVRFFEDASGADGERGSREIAAFLENEGVKISGVSPELIDGKVLKKEKGRGLW